MRTDKPRLTSAGAMVAANELAKVWRPDVKPLELMEAATLIQLWVNRALARAETGAKVIPLKRREG